MIGHLAIFGAGEEIPWPQPSTRAQHLLIDRLDNKLYHFREGLLEKEYVVSTGLDPGATPAGVFYVSEMALDPGGPFGTRWIGLSCPDKGRLSVGIHGTDEPETIGEHMSAGCIRLKNPDAEELFGEIDEGVMVVIR